MKLLAKFWLTTACVTSFPLAMKETEQADLSGLTIYLPAVGLLIALVLELIAWICHLLIVPHLVTATILTVGWLGLSGCIHMDGLMDTADGIFSHRSPERMLQIMQDSRVGNFGVIAGLAAILIKVATMASAPFALLQLALLLVPVWSRWSETFAIAYFPYLRPEGMGKIWHDSSKFPADVVSAALLPLGITVLVSFVVDWHLAFILAAFTALTGVISAFRIASILRGQTGDTYGAVVELAESGALLLAAVLLPQWRF